MLITIGTAATDRGSYTPSGMTFIATENPANADGVITLVALWVYLAIETPTIIIFEKVNGNTFTARSHQTVANLAEGYREVEVSLEVKTGDYIGIFFWNGRLDRDLSGDGYWYLSEDQTECENVEFTFQDDRTLSLYGTGEEVVVGGRSFGFIIG